MPAKKKAAKRSSKKAAGKSSKSAVKKAPAKPSRKAAKKPAAVSASNNAPAAATNGARHLINVDLAKVWDKPGEGRKFVTVLGWGDKVAVLNADTMEADGHIKVRATRFVEQSIGTEEAKPEVGYIVPKSRPNSKRLTPIQSGATASLSLPTSFRCERTRMPGQAQAS